jgi:flavin-dependent dehydrogenase
MTAADALREPEIADRSATGSAEEPPRECDVLVIGGAFAGAAVATLLRRFAPAARVLVVEPKLAFDRKVGEATVEVSAAFLHRVLGLYGYLCAEQLPKHGLRYWFHHEQDPRRAELGFEDLSEVGPGWIATMPSFQLDRAKLDERMLAGARAAGAQLLRPARVAHIECGWPGSVARLEGPWGEREVRTRWVIDASGRQAFLARRMGLLERNERHPTSAWWGRFRGVLNLDGPEVLGRDPQHPRLPYTQCARRLATNHFCGFGYWCWAIPLAGGDTSIGLVFDERYYEPPAGANPRERFLAFLRAHPGLRELVARAELDVDDFHSRRHLAYRSRRFAERGWLLVGDAAAFIDPFYSPGLDFASFSTYASARLVAEELNGRLPASALERAVAEHQATFDRYYERYFEALYLDKYAVMGDAELMGAAYLLDTSLYYMGVVHPTQRDIEEYRYPPLGRDVRAATIAWKVLRFYNQRLVRLAHARRAAGTYGRRNARWHVLGRSFDAHERVPHQLWTGLRLWLGAEASGLVDRALRRRAQPPLPAELSLAPSAVSQA